MGREKEMKGENKSREKSPSEVEEEDLLVLDEELETAGTETLGYTPKKKPELSPSLKKALRLREEKKSRNIKFRRQEWFRYKRLGEKWRKPRGLHSKMRRKMKYRQKPPSIGYGSPFPARGLHPSGFREVLVYNVNDLVGIEPKREAARIGHSVGTRKRRAIIERAAEMEIRILNPGEI